MFTENEMKRITQLSKQMEEAQTILPEILEILYEHKLFKVFAPNALGGLELSLIDGLKTFQQAGVIDGNVGWAVTIGSGGNMFIPLFNEKVCESYFIHKEAVIAGSGKFGVAKKGNGGYFISGQWKYCSGADYATLFTMNCRVEGNDEIVTCSVPREMVEVIPDWNAFGLKATSSHSMKVENVFVKEEETFKFGSFQNKYELPVHSFPFMTFSEASFFSLCLGLTENLMHEAKTTLERKKEQLTLERYKVVKDKWTFFYEKEKNIEQQFYRLVSDLWEKHKKGSELQEDELTHFTAFCKEQSGELLQSAHILMRYFGMEAIMEKSPLNRAWRNLCTASQHAMLTP